jgi:hypothetical protein
VLATVAGMYRNHDVAAAKTIRIDAPVDIPMMTDRAIR